MAQITLYMLKLESVLDMLQNEMANWINLIFPCMNFTAWFSSAQMLILAKLIGWFKKPLTQRISGWLRAAQGWRCSQSCLSILNLTPHYHCSQNKNQNTVPLFYGSLFRPLNKTHKKGNCEFLTQKFDFFLTIASLHLAVDFFISQMREKISELQEKTKICEFIVWNSDLIFCNWVHIMRIKVRIATKSKLSFTSFI